MFLFIMSCGLSEFYCLYERNDIGQSMGGGSLLLLDRLTVVQEWLFLALIPNSIGLKGKANNNRCA